MKKNIITQAWLADFYADGVKPKYKGSLKRQAASVWIFKSILNKCQDTGTWKQFAGALTGLLGKYKSIVWMLDMKGNLMGRKPNFVIGCYF